MLAVLGRHVQSICQPRDVQKSYAGPQKKIQKSEESCGSIEHRQSPPVQGNPRPQINQPKNVSRTWRVFIWILRSSLSFICWRILQHFAQYLPVAVRGELWAFPWFLLFWSRYFGCAGKNDSNEVTMADDRGCRSRNVFSGQDSTQESAQELTHRYDANSVAFTEELNYGTENDIGAYTKMLGQRLKAQKPPSSPEELLASGWQEHPKRGLRIFLAAQERARREPYPRVAVYIKSKSQDQVASFPLVRVESGYDSHPAQLRGGGLVIYFSMKYWPVWFPFSQKVTLLKQISPFEQIWVHQLKVLWFTVDQVVLFALQDKLETEGCIEVLMRSPPEGMEGKQWLGVTIPKSDARFRTQIASMRLAGYPTSADHSDFEFQCEIYDPFKAGINWIVVMFWQTLAPKILPLILKMQAKFEGSDMDKYYNSGDDPNGKATQEAFISLHSKIQKFLQDKVDVN